MQTLVSAAADIFNPLATVDNAHFSLLKTLPSSIIIITTKTNHIIIFCSCIDIRGKCRVDPLLATLYIVYSI